MAVKEQTPEQMEQAETLLMIPDYLHFLLSGQKVTEYTNASTTQLLNPQTKDWDWDLIDRLGYKRELFRKLSSGYKSWKSDTGDRRRGWI